MSSWMIAAGYAMGGALLAMMLIGIAFSAIMPTLGRWNRRYFLTFFSLLFLYVVVIFIDLILYAGSDTAKAGKALVLIEYLFFSVLTLIPIPFLLHCSEETVKGSAVLRAGVALWVLFWILMLGGQYTDVFYYIAPDHQYTRGSLFPLLMAPLALIMLLTIAALFKRRKQLSNRIFAALLIYLLPTALLIILYMFAPVDIFLSLWMVLCAQTMFGLILTDNIEQFVRQQQEIAHQRASVMVLQMRPHFIYNTLMSIYSLCNQDPGKARQVTKDFTDYLRKNFTAVASENLIPFSAELEHTRAYLAVEQAQYEEMLTVDYDTPFIRFRLPPLTLQPIAENAVKHGIDPYAGPLHISIRTRQTSDGCEITVENNGPDFNPINDNEPHIALANIRQRLRMMCGGKLNITPRDGGGTMVKVTIPLQNPEAVQE